MVQNQGERWWDKLEQRHERSGIGSLVRVEDLYLSPWELQDSIRAYNGFELDQLGAVDVLEGDRSDASEIEFATRPTMRFHGSIPALIDQLKVLMQSEARVLIAAPNQGEVERLAGLMQEYGVAYRIGSRVDQGGSTTVYSESSYMAGDLSTPVIVRAAIANGVQVLDLDRRTARQVIVIGANDINDDADVMARPARRKSKTAAFVSDFRDLAVGDFVVHVEHGIARYDGLADDRAAGRIAAGADDSDVRGRGEAVYSADAAGLDPEISLDRDGAGAAVEPAGKSAWAKTRRASRRPWRIWPRSC